MSSVSPCLKPPFFKVIAGASDIRDRKKKINKCRQIQTVRKTIKPKHFKRSVETDIVILVMYEPFKLTECGVRLVKMAPLNYDYRRIGE